MARWRDRTESGTGTVGTSFGAVVFLAFLALAAHTLIGLYATSVVSSVAWDGARTIASNVDDPQAVALAKADVERRLHGFKDVQVDVATSPADVVVVVSADRPQLLPRALAESANLARINRTVHVHPERVQ